jgi:hypothetical protein
LSDVIHGEDHHIKVAEKSETRAKAGIERTEVHPSLGFQGSNPRVMRVHFGGQSSVFLREILLENP